MKLKDRYKKELLPRLIEELKLKNKLEAPIESKTCAGFGRYPGRFADVPGNGKASRCFLAFLRGDGKVRRGGRQNAGNIRISRRVSGAELRSHFKGQKRAHLPGFRVLCFYRGHRSYDDLRYTADLIVAPGNRARIADLYQDRNGYKRCFAEFWRDRTFVHG